MLLKWEEKIEHKPWEFIPQQQKKIEVETLKDNVNVNVQNFNPPMSKPETGSREFKMEFPVNDPDNIKILELKDMSTMDHEIQQASEGFVMAVGQPSAYAETKPL